MLGFFINEKDDIGSWFLSVLKIIGVLVIGGLIESNAKNV